MNMRSGGQVLMDQLRLNHVEYVFGVPGESYLAMLDAFADAPVPEMVTFRNEGGAAFAAEAWGRATGRPGVCVVTRGPGATNASIGVHSAMQSSTPMILLVGQVARGHQGREAFQEIDVPATFGPLAKWAAQVPTAERIPEFLSRAFHVAQSGRPGPVVLSLPEDMLTDQVDVADGAPALVVSAAACEAEVDLVLDALAGAQTPIMVVGGSGWSQSASTELATLAQRWNIPVCVELRSQDYLDNYSAHYVGELGLGPNPRLTERVRSADLVLALGSSLGDIASDSFRTMRIPVPQQKLIHVMPSADELGLLYRPDLGLVANSLSFLEVANRREARPGHWSEWSAAARDDFLDWTQDLPTDWPVDLTAVIRHLEATLPPEAIITNGAGNYTIWGHRYYRFRRFRTQFGPISGAMGYGLPAGIAAKLANPDSPVVVLAGDGCFLMNGQELATAAMLKLNIVIVVINNGILGSIRMYQEREHPGRNPGTTLYNPDFVQYAKSFGASARLVESTSDFAEALEQALAHAGPALIEIRTDPEQLTPTFSVVSEIERILR